MVDLKKPAPATTTAKPTTANTTRPSLPSLSPSTIAKTAAADVQPASSAAAPTASAKATQPVSTEPKPTAAPAAPSKPAEVPGKKLRTKTEILAALHAGARVVHTESGLYRIVVADVSLNPASKRRILSLISLGILKPNGEGNGRVYILDAEAEKKASEKKPVVKPVGSAATNGESTK
jgi:hypothetical protein